MAGTFVNLGDRLEREGPLPWDEALAIGVKLGRALETAHRAGFLHGDIKPSSVVISANGEPVLGDFREVRTVDLTDAGATHRSPSVPYTAPEIIRGSEPTVSSDIYSLGATIFALIAGHPPFHRPGETSVIAQLGRITNDAAPDLRVRGVPSALCRVVERALAKQPDERPPSAQALTDELRQVQRDLGKTATPIPSRRRRWPLGVAAGVIAIAAVAATALSARDGGGDAPQVAGVTQSRPADDYEPLPAGAGTLPSGLYRTTTFTPALRFAVPEGWRLGAPETASVINLTRGDTPATDRFSLAAVTSLPDELVDWLRMHPRLTTSEPATRALGSASVTEIDVSVPDGVVLLPVAGETSIDLAAGNTNRLYVFDVGGKTVVAIVEARPAGFMDLATEAEKVLASVQPG